MKALLKKEAKEIMRTYRVWAIPVFLLFAALSAPASAKFLPDILKTQLEAQNIQIKLPEPSAVEAFQAYFKNLTQLGLIAIILLSMGLISEEKSRGILAQVVVKPVSRRAMVAAKLAVHGGWWLLSLAMAAIVCYLYTLGLFGQADLSRFLLANVVFAVYLFLIFSITLAASAALRSQGITAAVALAGYFLFSSLTVFGSKLAEYSPGALTNLAFNLISGQGRIREAIIPATISLVLAATVLHIGAVIFERLEL